MASSAQGGSLVFNYSSMLQRGANLADILNPSLARQNLGIASGTLTPGVGLTGPVFSGAVSSNIAVNASQDGFTSSTSNTLIAQYDLNGNLTANTVTASNVILGSFTNSPKITLGGTGSIQCYAGGAGNLLISSTSSGVIGINSPNGSISQSAVNGLELFATGTKTITAGSGTTIQLYTGSLSPYALTVNGGVNSNGKLTVLGGATTDTLSATTSITSPVANITALTSTTETTGLLTATNASISSTLTSQSTLIANTIFTSNTITVQPPTPFHGTPTATVISNNGMACLTQMLLSAPTVAQTSTSGSSINLTGGTIATQALTVSGGLLCNLTSGFGLASNALTVVGGLLVDSVNSVFRQPALPNFCVTIPSPQNFTTGVMTSNISSPVGFTFASNFGYINFLNTGRYRLSIDCNGFTGSSQCNFSVQLVAYSNGTPLTPSYPVGQFITASGSYTCLFDATAGMTLNINTTATAQIPCVFTRFVMTCHFLC